MVYRQPSYLFASLEELAQAAFTREKLQSPFHSIIRTPEVGYYTITYSVGIGSVPDFVEALKEKWIAQAPLGEVCLKNKSRGSTVQSAHLYSRSSCFYLAAGHPVDIGIGDKRIFTSFTSCRIKLRERQDSRDMAHYFEMRDRVVSTATIITPRTTQEAFISHFSKKLQPLSGYRSPLQYPWTMD